MAEKPIRVGLLVDVQYPPHPAPVPAGRIVTDFPVASLAGSVKREWVMRLDTAADEKAFKARTAEQEAD